MTPFANILFVSDRSNNDAAALRKAMELADINQAQLTVASLAEVSEKQKAASDAKTKRLLGAIVDQQHDELESLVRDTSSNRLSVNIQVLLGRGFVELIRTVLRHQYDR